MVGLSLRWVERPWRSLIGVSTTVNQYNPKCPWWKTSTSSLSQMSACAKYDRNQLLGKKELKNTSRSQVFVRFSWHKIMLSDCYEKFLNAYSQCLHLSWTRNSSSQPGTEPSDAPRYVDVRARQAPSYISKVPVIHEAGDRAALGDSDSETSDVTVKHYLLCSLAEKKSTKIKSSISPVAAKQWLIRNTSLPREFTVNLPQLSNWPPG